MLQGLMRLQKNYFTAQKILSGLGVQSLARWPRWLCDPQAVIGSMLSPSPFGKHIFQSAVGMFKDSHSLS